jgi:hypothetical protein
MAQNKPQEGDMMFAGGMNSLLDPVLLTPGTYPRSVNTVSRGGVLQTRPGYVSLLALPNGNQQGGELFFPRQGPAICVFGVSGSLYASEFPFKTFRQLPGIQFSSTTKQLFFKQAVQSVKSNDDGSITFLERPRDVMIVQDGGDAQAVVFDGTTATHTADIPSGGPMEWVGERLWVMRGGQIIPSDYANPLSFIEWYFIPNAPKYLVLPARGTALKRGPSTTVPQLFAWTAKGTTLIQAGVRNREAWWTTTDFQREIFPNVGCASHRSVVNHYGMLWWFTGHGWTSLDAAAQTNVSSELPYKDGEMAESKGLLATDLSGVCAASFENYCLVSVPHGDKFNAHTWVMDMTPLQSRAVPIWNSIWTGTRPVNWMTGSVNGREHCLFISNDYDGQARLWKAFTPDRLDNGCPITSWAETRAVSLGALGKNKEFRYADVYLSELKGPVDVGVFWAGSHRGRYKKIQTKRILASAGSLRVGVSISATDTLFGTKKQSRLVRSQDGRKLASTSTLPSSDVEAPNAEFVDEAFQILVVWSGPAAIRGFNVYTEVPKNDDDAGRVEKDETEERMVRFDGAAATGTYPEVLAALAEDLPVFVANRTVTVSSGGQSAVATGSAESLISQANADRVAETVARRRAAEELSQALPKIVSIGEKANEI